MDRYFEQRTKQRCQTKRGWLYFRPLFCFVFFFPSFLPDLVNVHSTEQHLQKQSFKKIQLNKGRRTSFFSKGICVRGQGKKVHKNKGLNVGFGCQSQSNSRSSPLLFAPSSSFFASDLSLEQMACLLWRMFVESPKGS